jgi:hypothetical protein
MMLKSSRSQPTDDVRLAIRFGIVSDVRNTTRGYLLKFGHGEDPNWSQK